ncbi:MAG: DUF58 domain-containing protein [Chloroflexi bacterium]|nr:DUF58 domain-containing protein [Chloroflexota bacterium]
MKLQPSQLSWIAAALLLLVAGLVLGNVVLLAGAVFVLVTALMSTTLRPPNGVDVTRSPDTVTRWVGETLAVERRLTARAGIGAIFVHDELPAEAELVSGSNLRVVWKWPGSHRADISYKVRFPRRGTFALPQTSWDARAPFGVSWSATGSAGGEIQVSVVPRIRSIARLNALRTPTRSNSFGNNRSTTGADSDEFRELRPYQPGDPFNRINWKASARGTRTDNLPIVNELYPEAKRGAWIFLDTATYMDVGSPLSNPLEHSVEASGALAQYYLGRGSTVGAYAFNSLDGRGGLLTPDSGRTQFRRLVQMLAGLKPGASQEDLLQATERCKSFLLRLQPDVFVITRLDVQYDRPGETSASLERFKTAIRRLVSLGAAANRRNRVCVVHVSPPQSAEFAPGLRWSGWEAQLIAAEVARASARVIEWEPEAEEFASVLLRYVTTDR